MGASFLANAHSSLCHIESPRPVRLEHAGRRGPVSFADRFERMPFRQGRPITGTIHKGFEFVYVRQTPDVFTPRTHVQLRNSIERALPVSLRSRNVCPPRPSQICKSVDYGIFRNLKALRRPSESGAGFPVLSGTSAGYSSPIRAVTPSLPVAGRIPYPSPRTGHARKNCSFFP